MGQRNFKPAHKKETNFRRFNGRKHIDDMYDYKWEQYRKRFLAINPECYACGKPANVVDHLKPHVGDEFLFKKTDNHIPLCESCHNYVTAKFDIRYKIGNPVTDKIKWLNSRRIPTDKWTPKRVKVLTRYEE